MKTITVTVSGMQAVDYSTHVPGVVLRPGKNDIAVLSWLDLRGYLKRQIEGGYVSVNAEEEAAAIKSYKQGCFSSFEALGVPAVKVASESGEYSKGALRDIANEWLISKSEDRTAAALAASLEANALARDANSIAQSSSQEASKANRRASIALVFAAIATVAAIAQAIAAFK